MVGVVLVVGVEGAAASMANTMTIRMKKRLQPPQLQEQQQYPMQVQWRERYTWTPVHSVQEIIAMEHKRQTKYEQQQQQQQQQQVEEEDGGASVHRSVSVEEEEQSTAVRRMQVGCSSQYFDHRFTWSLTRFIAQCIPLIIISSLHRSVCPAYHY
jgi:hypothetical protein